MAKKLKLKVGSKIVEGGKAYKVTRVEKKKIKEIDQKIIHYEPYFKDSNNRSLICSIPESSLEDANIRKPVTAVVIKEILKSLSKKPKYTQPLNNLKAKEVLKTNGIRRTSKVLKNYWRAKIKNDGMLTKSEKDVFEEALQKLAEEVAMIQRTLPRTAETKILNALQR